MRIIAPPELEIPELSVSPDLNPTTLEYIRARGEDGNGIERDPLLDGLGNAVKAANAVAKEIVTIADTARADDTLTRAAAALHVANAARERGTRIATKLDDAVARVKTAIEALDKETSAPPPPADPHALALEAEIRATLRSMTPKARSAAISSAIANDQLAVIGAVLRGQAMLSGMTDAEREVRRHSYRQRAHADALKRLTRYKKDLETAQRAGTSFVQLVLEATDNKLATTAESKRAARIKATEIVEPQTELPLEG